MDDYDFKAIPNDAPIAKRSRQERMDLTSNEPSPVVVVRNLADRASEADLLEALHHFGSIAYASIFPRFRYGLVEFEDVKSAMACVQYSRNSAIYVAGSVASFFFAVINQIDRMGFQSATPNHVLILVVHNVQYPITVEVIHTICKPHGTVQRISLIRKRVIQALVEFDSVASARNAKHQLNGADIYQGSCTLKVDFAKVDTVRVRQNDTDNWDYTQSAAMQHNGPPVAGRKTLLVSPGGGNNKPGLIGVPPVAGGGGMGEMGFGPGSGMMNSGGGGGPPMNNMNGGMGGGMSMGMGLRNNPAMAAPYGGGDPYGGGPGVRQSLSSDNWGGMSSGGPPMESQQAPLVLMMYGVDQENWSCEKIFNLLCLYGNVNRIKMLKSKPDTAMVEMGDQKGGNDVMIMLRNLLMFEKDIEFKRARVDFIGASRGDENDLFKDYERDRRNRFTTTGRASKNHIVAPSRTLHWFNVPPTMTEESIAKILADATAPVATKITVNQNPKSGKSSSGSAQFETVAQSIEALIKTNHTSVFADGNDTPYVMKLAFENERLRRGGEGPSRGMDNRRDYMQ